MVEEKAEQGGVQEDDLPTIEDLRGGVSCDTCIYAVLSQCHGAVGGREYTCTHHFHQSTDLNAPACSGWRGVHIYRMKTVDGPARALSIVDLTELIHERARGRAVELCKHSVAERAAAAMARGVKP
jgi:hypothetical protein